MMLTIGMALGRAADQGVPVRILVEGEWILGTVQDNGDQSVMLADDSGALVVARIEAVSAVHFGAVNNARPAPRGSIPTQASHRADPDEGY